MPKGWPLPELQPPAGSLDANLPEPAPEGYGDARMIVDLPFNLGTDQEGRLWRRAFRLPGASLQTVCDFVEARLKPEGYYLYWHEDGRGREYISPDGRYIAQVYYWPDSETFHLQVSVYKTAWRPDSHGPVHSS